MDPTILASSAKTVAGDATRSAVRRTWRAIRLSGTYEAKWLDLPGLNGTDEKQLTAAEVADIEAFMQSPQVGPLLSLYLFVQLAGDEPREDMSSTIASAFQAAAKRWTIDNKQSWLPAAENLWQRVRAFLSASLPDARALPDLKDEIDQFATFLRSPLKSAGRNRSPGTAFLEHLSYLAQDLDRLSSASDLIARLRSIQRTTRPHPIFTHADVERDIPFDRLYVGRTLYRRSDNEAIDSDALLMADAPFRVVVLGAPGAGKSTLVGHMVDALYRSTEPINQPVLIIRCRDYHATGWQISIQNFLTRMITSTYGINTENVVVEDSLILGRLGVVFDGLDEITDGSSRSDMARRIESFASWFPGVSILVTSRTIGYETASVASSLFEHYQIDEFTIEQVEEYSSRWFSLVGKAELTSAFMHESTSVPDLRRNPLLLSLLCILFRARGAIPRKRREIYMKCADLLFHRWDAHRQIHQPEELPTYGDRIMQEIARWVYDFPSAQNGLEERQVVKAISTYLTDVAGVDPDAARRRAEEFLEFCAGRAWLLAKIGTNQYDERVFGFTHRTFFEYFAAEAFARQSREPHQVCERILTAYRRDATSVMPELLIQAYDDKEDRGAAAVFRSLCESEHANALLVLRLMNGVLLPNHVRERGFELLLDEHQGVESLRREVFHALIELNPDARHQFVNRYLDGRTSPPACDLFLYGWASLSMSGEATRFANDWSGTVDVAASQYIESGTHQMPPRRLLDNWLVDAGHLKPHGSVANYLVVDAWDESHPGALWWAIERNIFHGQKNSNDDSLIRRFSMWLAKSTAEPRVSIGGLGDALEDRVSELIRALGRDAISLGRDAASQRKNYRDALIAITLLVQEGYFAAASLLALTSEIVSLPLIHLCQYRNWRLGTGSPLDEDEVGAARQVVAELPRWWGRWAEGAATVSMQRQRLDLPWDDDE
jgi:NACHT domain